MKKVYNKFILLTLIFNLSFLIFNSPQAQTIPAGVNFQAIARGASGNVLVSTGITVKVSILDGSASGAVLGSYVYAKNTDAYGQFTIAIGSEMPSSSIGLALSAIDWTAASRWIKVEFDPAGGTSFTLISNSEATASFYAFAAKKSADGNPSGAIIAYGGASAPSGWLLCDGSAVSRTTYATLFAAIGVAYGSGDGSTTFNLPDLRGRFARGVDGTANNDPDNATRTASNTGGNTGNAVGSLESDELKSHTHTFRWTTASGTTGDIGSSFRSNGAYLYNNTEGQIISSGGNETRPKNVYVNYIIKQ